MDTIPPEQLLSYIQIVRELKALTPTPNLWIPFWSVVAGACLGFIPQAIGAVRRDHNARKTVQAALLAEVSYIVKMINIRNYLNDAKQTYTDLMIANNRDSALAAKKKAHFQEHKEQSIVSIQPDYNKVFKAHLEKLGLLPEQFAIDIVTFYGLLDAVVQDLRPEGVLREQGYAAQYKEAIKLMEEALELAYKLGVRKT
ncbi:hypothetical protein [Pseudomonas capsici]|uniref:Uncharacterized protein n=1 Tax=Pseudomonas capsici TaxID=2810614 RepID=A0ABT3BQR6_9PSED|nr:hypothetical protein [Pseudomonas capsici]MBN6712584.1 hypothetical protein [Pseudomonas capsici]MBN6717679.1 hypothetical protein [Pseudomonas capsici]MBN6723270.1 hypothetical protein [Pseudomonas capsici]MCV4267067.1 hypothetical protein [Pseudomonas capsici]MCV4276309.1 hypothetical protein [Pseudomonas capsici]